MEDCVTTKQTPCEVKTRYQPKRGKLEIYSCDHCPAHFIKETQLRNHAKSHVTEAENKCDKCLCVFSSHNKLTRHKQKVHCEIVVCKFCDANFNHINSLKLHMRLHTGEKPFACNECGARFVQSSHLSIHKRSHTGEKPYQCNICKQTFKQISHLRSHERIHTQTKPYSCEYCGKSFIQKSSLKRHIRIHTGERPYLCEVCDASFCVKNNLNRHMIVHTGENPYNCDICDHTFSQYIDLKRHTISHSGIKPFGCDQCNASFSRKSNLKWHKFIHTGEAPFKCDQCDCKYSKPRELKKHKLTKHSNLKAYNCSICKESFNQPAKLKKHMASHSGEKLGSCEEKFADKNSLRRHKNKNSTSLSSRNCNSHLSDEEDLDSHLTNVMKHELEEKATEVLSLPEADENKKCQEMQEDKYEACENSNIDISYVPLHDYSQHYSTSLVNSHEVQQSSVNYPAFVDLTSMHALPQTPAVQTLLLSSVGSNPSMRVGRLASSCGNHSMHIFILGSNNQVQSWCFCESPSRPTSMETPQLNTGFNDAGAQISESSIVGTEHTEKHVHNNMGLQATSIVELGNGGCFPIYNSESLSSHINSSHRVPVVINPQIAEEKVLTNDQFQYLVNSSYPSGNTMWISNVIDA